MTANKWAMMCGFFGSCAVMVLPGLIFADISKVLSPILIIGFILAALWSCVKSKLMFTEEVCNRGKR